MCGIAAAYMIDHGENVAHTLFQMLLSQDNRMNYSAGINVFDENRLNDFLITESKGLGPVETAFGLREERIANLDELIGYAGVAQGRYATSNSNRIFTPRQRLAMAQPCRNIDDYRANTFSFSFNGNIANINELMSELKGPKEGYHIRTDTDTEVLRILLKKGISKALETGKKKPRKKELFEEDFKKVFSDISKKVQGAYSMTFIDGTGNMILARDPHGLRPLVYGVRSDGVLAASESTALRDQDIEPNQIRNVPPGHLIIIDKNHRISKPIQFAKPDPHMCIFEHVYFGHVTADYNGMNNQEFREEVGARMAESEPDIKFGTDHYLACIPETSRPYIDGYQIGCIRNGRMPPPILEALIKRRHYRSFMEDTPERRIEKVKAKFRSSWGKAKGKILYIGDDSTVRLDVLQGLIPHIKRELQPAEIHLRIFYDQFRNICVDGIDVPDISRLGSVRFGEDPERIRDQLKIDSLKYTPIKISLDVASELSGHPREHFCTGCTNGNYATDFHRKLAGITSPQAP